MTTPTDKDRAASEMKGGRQMTHETFIGEQDRINQERAVKAMLRALLHVQSRIESSETQRLPFGNKSVVLRQAEMALLYVAIREADRAGISAED